MDLFIEMTFMLLPHIVFFYNLYAACLYEHSIGLLFSVSKAHDYLMMKVSLFNLRC
jgi:hypothetical protein